MNLSSPPKIQTSQHDTNLFFHLLDKGIHDMEAGRELPLEDAFKKISELRDNKRHAGI